MPGWTPEVVLEATYGWYWAVDALQGAGAQVHLAHPLGVKMFEYRRVENDVRDATDLADLLRMGRLPEAWIAPPETRELCELVRHRAKLVGLRSHCTAEVHGVLAKCGIQISLTDLFGVSGLELGEIRTHRWVGRRAAGRLADKTPGGSPLHGLLPGEVEQILAFVRRVGRDRQVASQARAPRLLPGSGVGVAVERPAGPFRCRQVLPAAAEAG